MSRWRVPGEPTLDDRIATDEPTREQVEAMAAIRPTLEQTAILYELRGCDPTAGLDEP